MRRRLRRRSPFRLPVPRHGVVGTVILAVVLVVGSTAVGLCQDAGTVIEVTSAAEQGPGTLRAAIAQANELDRSVRIVSRLPAGSRVKVTAQLPPLTGYGIGFDARGLTLVGGTCTRPDGRLGCDGLVVSGPKIVVRGLRAEGFMFDGIAVRGAGADDVLIEQCQARRNLDDGIGISAKAGMVTVRDCLLEGNGFRTKGKGILVFDEADARLIDNTVRGNRDGVTVSRKARARLEGNRIVANYDKGLGVAGAYVTGRGNRIEKNGQPAPGGEKPPNGDGLRVTLGSTVLLEQTRIRENGDAGVVVLDDSTVSLAGAEIEENGGVGIDVRDTGVIELHEVSIAGNRGGPFTIKEAGRIVRTR